MKLVLASSLIVGGLFLAAPVSAQGVATAPATATTAKPSPQQGVQTPKSKACSLEADKQGLHGKARKAFRNKCKHA